ncbi:Matrix-remodeling-associated protein 5 [Larimichthys crocea]|uniref:Matrix-remodeling-associated protein 5 n=1 Tax=Larimichthys crocea TaxID=215358 RepID=A0A6G0I4H7_LARCR|nr:Matrix-remodeling-associated protein 5 [Larimichthys crocea]
MALWWCANILCRLAAACFPLLFSSLLWQTISLANAIPSCPQSCSCPGVKEVHCTFRHLTAIPKTFPKDTERLNFGYNSLTEVEGSEFRSLRQLEMLMLHGNDISTVHPGAFYSLRSLQILKLSYNKLTSVNAGLFEGLVGLIRLHLDHNLIDFIEPYSFSGLTSLKLLQLEGNLLKEIHPHTFITVSLLGSFWTSGLKHLHLSDNLLEQLPAAALNTAPRLELLSLHGNPWTCDCQLNWLVEWSTTHEGIIKCKKERGASEVCPQCSSPRPLNGTSLLGLTPDKLTCERPALRSSLKQWDNPVWAESEAEPDLPYTRDFEKPLGHLTIVLSDSHGNNAHVACGVRHPGESSPMTWIVNPLSPGELSVNVSLATVLECEIDRETLQNLWQLVAYYYESPAILERGQQKGNASRITYQYSQTVNENSPYFTDLKGYLVAEPSWLLQPRVTLRLNRRQTTTKKLVMDFTTVITKNINSHRGQEDDNAMSWALIRRGTSGRIQTALDGSGSHLVPTHRPWSLPHPWAHNPVVTNRPEITAETVKPTPTVPGTTGNSRFTHSKPHISNHNQHQNHHVDVRTQTRDQLFLLRLRNRYRQVQLDRIAQLGRIVTPKPRTSYYNPPFPITSKPNPSPHRPYTPKPPAPTASYTYTLKPAKPSSSSFSGFIPTPHPYHPTTPGVLYGGRWPVGGSRANQLSATHSCSLLSPWVLGAENGGMKPRITTVATASVSVLAESDVVLPCKASGNPEANIAWTKVSTGATIPANTKLGPRFEVFKNGTFVIKNIQLQDRALPPSISEGAMDTVIIPPGRSVYVHCSVKGEPIPTLKWTLPGGVHVKPSQFLGRRLFVFPNGTLYVKNVSPVDAGRYECLATNPVGMAKRTVQLEVRASSPSVSHQPPAPLPIPPTHRHGVPSRQHSVSAMYGSAVYLHCPESSGSTRGTIWQLPSKTIMEHRYSPERPIKVFRNGTLRILQLTELDGGSYLCVFQRPNGEDMELFQVEVLMTPPRIEHVRTAQTRVTFGDNFQVDCVATGLPDPEVSWSLPDGTMINNALQSDDSGLRNRRYVIFGNGTLLLQQMGKKDEGDYTCFAKNKLGKDERKSGRETRTKSVVGHSLWPVTPNTLPRWSLPSAPEWELGTEREILPIKQDGQAEKRYALEAGRKPVIRGSTGGMKITYGNILNLPCTVDGWPQATITWTLPNGLVLDKPQTISRISFFVNGTLQLRQVATFDKGTYTCKASNSFGSSTLSYPVAVMVFPPRITNTLTSITRVSRGSPVMLNCVATGIPKPDISWTLPGRTTLVPHNRFTVQGGIHMTEEGSLIIQNPVLMNSGIYKCNAKNALGTDFKSTYLQVV